jgi:hypothetical protein
VFKKGGEAHAVVGEVWLFADDGDGVFAGAGVEFEEFFSSREGQLAR